jgi:cell division protein FtsZ
VPQLPPGKRSPLLEASIEGARGILFNISGGSDLGIFEVNEAAEIVRGVAHPDANIIFGTVLDDAMADEVRVTVIAAGFDRWDDKRDPKAGSAAPRPDGGLRSVPSAADDMFAPPKDDGFDDDEFDVPSFLK